MSFAREFEKCRVYIPFAALTAISLNASQAPQISFLNFHKTQKGRRGIKNGSES